MSTVSHLKGQGINALFIRKERKDHGTGRLIDGLGAVPGASNVAVLEDVLTTGGSLKFAAEQVLDAGHKVVVAVVLVDREEGGDAVGKELNVPLVSIFKKRDFVHG